MPARSEREVVVTLRLPRELHSRLRDIGGDRGLTAQIREALEAKLSGGTGVVEADPTTQRLLSAIARIAREVEAAYSPWHQDAYAFKTLRDSTVELLAIINTAGGRGVSDAALDDKPKPKPPKEASPLGRMVKHRGLEQEDVPGELATLAAAKEGFGW